MRSPEHPLILIPRLVVRERIPPPARTHLTLEPQMMHWQILGPDGRVVVREADQPCHNIVLNNAKELVATLGLFEQSNWAVVGTGSTAPAATQTGLAAEVARTNQTVSGNPDTVTEVSTGVWEMTRYRQFTAAQIGGQNLTEWGFSGSGTAGNNLMSRELFRDGSNNPVTLTLDSDQQLRLIYKVRVTVGPTTPQAAFINITGIGNRTGQFILFRNNSNSNLNPVESLSNMAKGTQPGNLIYHPNAITLNYSDASGPFLSGNLGDFAGSWQAYIANSKKRTQNSQTRTTNQVVGTIRGIGLTDLSGTSQFRVRLYFQFDSGQEITKSNLHELTIAGFEVQWT